MGEIKAREINYFCQRNKMYNLASKGWIDKIHFSISTSKY